MAFFKLLCKVRKTSVILTSRFAAVANKRESTGFHRHKMCRSVRNERARRQNSLIVR